MENLEAAKKKMTKSEADEIVGILSEKCFDSLTQLISQAASSLLGYSHGSDKFDDLGDMDLMEHLGFDSSSEEGSFERWDYLSEVKEKFGGELMGELSDDNNDLIHLSTFQDLLQSAKENDLKITEEELSDALKKSSAFMDMAYNQVTEYDG